LCEHLAQSGDDVLMAPGNDVGMGRTLEITSQASVSDVLSWASPEAVYHLAAVAFGPDAAGDLGHAIDVTVRGTGFILTAAAAMPDPPVVFLPSSAEVYPASESPISEQQAPAPANVYGATKLAQEALGLAFYRSHQLPVVVARAFNHIGPGQRPSFVVASLAHQLAAIGRGEHTELRVGNLSAERDFTDVRDIVRAYRLLVVGRHFGQPINVASGIARSIGSILDRLIELSGHSVDIVVDPARLRPVDVPRIRGDAGRLRSLTGWGPTVPWDDTLRDILDDARASV
jgi:GDP-4-dehydro-6-deoxy-D-mannose reductase